MDVRLIIHTDSIARSDVNTFTSVAKTLNDDYFRIYPKSNMVLKFVKFMVAPIF